MNELITAISNYLHRVGTYNPIVVVVEMLLIGVVVWLVVRFLRGTRGASLVKGAALVLAVVYLGIELLPAEHGWQRIGFLYGNFLLFAVLAFVVAFQPELRRALMQVGGTRLLGGQRTYAKSEIDALVESASHLSHNRTGVIMAIERRVGLGGLTEQGVRLDAELSASLLNTIFYPGTNLHDMGAVIQNGRITAAGCQFPLAESEDVEAALGSRHRAALGLAQETDAVVIVISEQTGRISAACDGQLYLDVGVQGLREMLEATLTRPTKKKLQFPRLRRQAGGGEADSP